MRAVNTLQLLLQRLPCIHNEVFLLFKLLNTCRCVGDGAATAEQQRSRQRTVLLLIAEHLAVIDQPPPSDHSTLAGGSTKSVSGAHDSLHKFSTPAGSSRSSSWITCTLKQLTTSEQSSRRVTSFHKARLDSSRDADTVAAWQQLQSMPETTFVEAIKNALLPRGVPNRVLLQLSHIAGFGRDPVLSMEPLHIAAAQQELRQLLRQQATAAQDVAGSHQAAFSTAAFTPRNEIWGSIGAGSKASSIMSAMDINWASKLLPCSAFTAAAHKLMWWLQGCPTQQQVTYDLAAALTFDAESPVRSIVQHDVVGFAASVAVLAGTWLPGISAVAATAAAALGAGILHLSCRTSQQQINSLQQLCTM